MNFLNTEGHQNPISGSKVTAILLKGWILPIGGASAGEGLPCSLRSRLVSKVLHTRAYVSKYYTPESMFPSITNQFLFPAEKECQVKGRLTTSMTHLTAGSDFIARFHWGIYQLMSAQPIWALCSGKLIQCSDLFNYADELCKLYNVQYKWWGTRLNTGLAMFHLDRTMSLKSAL